MAHAPKFASGKYAWGMCDICGIRSKLVDLKGTTVRGKSTGLLSCPTCWDPDHPQNFLYQYVTNDPQALRRPRPDTGQAASATLYPPGNWINGKPPSLPLQEAELQAQIADGEARKARLQAEIDAFLKGDQRMQRGE